MKTLALIALLTGALLATTGCATPGYSATEHGNQIARTWDYEMKMATDDWDFLLLLNPPTRLTIWDVR